MSAEDLAIIILFILIAFGDLAVVFAIARLNDIDSRLNYAETRINSILKRMKAEDKAIEDLGHRVDGAADVIVRVQNDYYDLLDKCEDTQWSILRLNNDVSRINIGGK